MLRKIIHITHIFANIFRNIHSNNNSHFCEYKVREKIEKDAEKTSFGDNTEHNPSSTEFCVGELIWGAAHGHPAWPGKIVTSPPGYTTPRRSTWVRWFGRRTNVEMVTILSLKSLSEGLDAHHKAQKDSRK